MAKTLDEIMSELTEYVGADGTKADELATALREKLKSVSQVLINVGAKLGKKEQSGKVAELQTKLQEAKEQLDTTTAEFTAFKERTPNVRDLEENEKRKWEPRIKQEQERATTAEARAKNLQQQVFRDKFGSHLTRADKAGVRLDDDPLIVRAIVEQYLDRYVPRDDGTEDVLQIDNDTPYDGRTLDDKIGALAEAARRRVNNKFLITTTDSQGSGVRPSNGVTGNSGQLTQEQVLERKRSNPAYTGL